jgi:hypothetical protein
MQIYFLLIDQKYFFMEINLEMNGIGVFVVDSLLTGVLGLNICELMNNNNAIEF